MGCSALTFGLQPNFEGEHECLCVYCVMECRVCMMWDARAVWHDGSSPRTAYRAFPDDFLASYADCITQLGNSGKGTSFSAQGLI